MYINDIDKSMQRNSVQLRIDFIYLKDILFSCNYYI